MKKLFILAIALILIHSCKKEVNDPPDSVRDIDGNLYKTVTISSQTWMAENLRVSRYRDGTPIPGLVDNKEWSGAYTGKSSDYNYISDSLYGKLYNWYAVEENAGHIISPKGWHMPTMQEWQALIDAMGSSYSAGGRLKDSLFWPKTNYYSGLKRSGFNARPAGYRIYWGTFMDKGNSAYFWTSSISPYYQYTMVAFFIDKSTDNIDWIAMERQNGLSVRCVKDR